MKDTTMFQLRQFRINIQYLLSKSDINNFDWIIDSFSWNGFKSDLELSEISLFDITLVDGEVFRNMYYDSIKKTFYSYEKQNKHPCIKHLKEIYFIESKHIKYYREATNV